MSHKRTMTKEHYRGYMQVYRGISGNTKKSPKERYIELDVLYHHILQSLGYAGSFGSILKQSPVVVKDLDTIWKLHKLRNRLVHEMQTISDREIETTLKEYLCETKDILSRYAS